MPSIDIQNEVAFDSPTLIEGLPGIGLVGKIVADHLIETLGMTYHAAVRCDGLPPVAVYHGEESMLKPPVRLYADTEHDVIVLNSDVPISSQRSEAFASCITDWITENDIMPLFLSGLPSEKKDHPPELFGIATGDGDTYLDREGIVPPKESGLVSGPTGALLNDAIKTDLTSVGLIVEADPQFPDPQASQVLLEHGIAPIADIEIDTDSLIEQAEEIREARERLAKQMQQAETNESSQAQPLRGFQ